MIYTNELKAGTQTDTCTPMFTAALFTLAKKKQLKCPSTDERINKMSYIHTTEFHSALKRNEIMIHATTWMKIGRASCRERV